MDMNDNKKEEETTLSNKFEHQASHIFTKYGKRGMDSVKGSS